MQGDVPTSIVSKSMSQLYIPRGLVSSEKGKENRDLCRRLKALSRLSSLPTVLLSNAQSIKNKVDELEVWAKFKPEIKETCLLAFTETWLCKMDWDKDLTINVFVSPSAASVSGDQWKEPRRGRYCNTVVVWDRICTPDIELLTISLHPYYLPCEFQQLCRVHPSLHS